MSEGDRYQHYKGGMYRVLRYGKLEATLEQVVIYEAESDGRVWVRAYDDFFATVPGEEGSAARRIPRFRLASPLTGPASDRTAKNTDATTNKTEDGR